MAKAFWERLRGARRLELFGAMVLAALVALLWMNSAAPPSAEKSPLEQRMESILSRIEGAGRVSVMVTQPEEGVITGALVVSPGAGDIGVYLKLQSAVQTLLDVELSQINIVGWENVCGG